MHNVCKHRDTYADTTSDHKDTCLRRVRKQDFFFLSSNFAFKGVSSIIGPPCHTQFPRTWVANKCKRGLPPNEPTKIETTCIGVPHPFPRPVWLSWNLGGDFVGCWVNWGASTKATGAVHWHVILASGSWTPNGPTPMDVLDLITSQSRTYGWKSPCLMEKT